MSLAALQPRMSEGEFNELRDHLIAYCGLRLADDARALLERRLAPRLMALGLGSFAAYALHVRERGRSGISEIELLAELALVHETYFFREHYQLDALRLEILPIVQRDRQRQRRLRIWSAGCSSGEEPYTVAILVQESRLFADWDVKVTGGDVSRRTIAVADDAEYGAGAFRQTEEHHRQRWFRRLAPGSGAATRERWRVVDELRALVRFQHLNLIDAATLPDEDVDVVLCRNVLMYLAPPARQKVIDALYERLRPGGWLLLGHSESLFNLPSRFALVRLTHDQVYRKP